MNPPSIEPPRVLAVDDNPSIRMMLDMLLRRLGCAPLTAHNGETALAMAAQSDVALILLDYNLPDMSGFEAACKLRAVAQTADIPIIGMSADPDFYRSHPEVMTAVDHAVDKTVLSEMLEELLRRHVGADELDIDELQQRCDVIGRENMGRAVAAFLTEGENQLAALATAVDAALTGGSPAAALEIAHRLKGGAAVFQMRRLRILLADLETALKNGVAAADGAQGRFNSVARGWRRARRRYADWLGVG